jgi:hypothetical protein
MKFLFLSFFVFLSTSLFSQILNVPARPANAPAGSAFAATIWSLPRVDREHEIYAQITSGNVPDFMRTLVPVTSTAIINGRSHTATYYVIPDYCAIGNDSDYFLMPMTPTLAQLVATALNCNLPTKKMVDQIYSAAVVKLSPWPIPPTDTMITVPVFYTHNLMVKSQRDSQIVAHPLGALVGGDKKDVVVTNKINNPTPTGKVAIYGWHQLNGVPIQPLYTGHADFYADYSHGIRLVQMAMKVDSTETTVANVLADPALSILLSDEGTIPFAKYPVSGAITIPPQPRSFGIINESSSSLRVLISYNNDTTNYTAYLSADGLTFTDSVELSRNDPVITGLQNDSLYFIRLRAHNSSGYSLFSEVLAAIPSAETPTALIVNGFDRASTGNTYNFIRQHGAAFFANNRRFASATNDAVVNGLIVLSQFQIADWILGDESTADETFSTAEQETVKTFLKNGGKLFVSGSEIGWDLDYKGSVSDKAFYAQYLKAQFVADNPGGQVGVYYNAAPVANGIFDGLGVMSFDNGTHGTINVKYPDVINGINGGTNCLAYSGVASSTAGISFEGVFPGGTSAGKVVNFGIPFETFYPESVRTAIMNRVLSFFDSPTTVGNTTETQPEQFSLEQNFPNPFNPTTHLQFSISNSQPVTLKVYDMLGREVATLVNERKSPGTYDVIFNGSMLSSGIYIYRLETSHYTLSRMMTLLK